MECGEDEHTKIAFAHGFIPSTHPAAQVDDTAPATFVPDKPDTPWPPRGRLRERCEEKALGL